MFQVMVVVGGFGNKAANWKPLHSTEVWSPGSTGWMLIKEKLKREYVGTKLVTMDNIIYMIGM